MTIKFSDDRGLICGFLLSSQGGMKSLEWEAAVSALNQPDGSPLHCHDPIFADYPHQRHFWHEYWGATLD